MWMYLGRLSERRDMHPMEEVITEHWDGPEIGEHLKRAERDLVKSDVADTKPYPRFRWSRQRILQSWESEDNKGTLKILLGEKGAT